MMAQAVEEWYKQMPIITGSYVTAAIVTTRRIPPGEGQLISFTCFLFGATLLTGIFVGVGMIPYISESFANIIFLSNSLTFMTLYVWSKQNPFFHISFIGLFTFTAAYLPWVLLGFSVLVGASAWVGLLGMIAGHTYYFLGYVYPRMTGQRPLRTPSFITALFADEPVVVVRPAHVRFAPPQAEAPHHD